MSNRINRPVALLILDGWGIAPESETNALALAHTPYYDEICSRFPRSVLHSSGEHVGLAADLPGNAEAGHLNLVSGRVVHSVAERIERSISNGEFFQNDPLLAAIRAANTNGKAVHLIGLVSDGGVHSSSSTLYALLRMAKQNGCRDVFVHCILDGRDVPSRTADIYIEALEIKMNEIGVGKIATLCGRHFAMDSGQNWDRTARAFTMMVHAEGERASDPTAAIRSSFLRGIADEFTAPIVIESEPERPVATICEGDTVIFFNRRADTSRQLVRALAIPEPGQAANSLKPAINPVCLVEYDGNFQLPVAFPMEDSGSSLNSVLAENQVPTWRFAEAERLVHLTGLMNGGVEGSGSFQQNILIPGPPKSAYFTEPELGSFRLTDQLIRKIESETEGLFIANYSAADIAAENVDLDRTVSAVQYVDTCVGGVLETMQERQGLVIITSTHGNCEEIVPMNSPYALQTGTVNRVPFHLIDFSGQYRTLRPNGTLHDVAPTVLGLVGIEKPDDMMGIDLSVT